MSDVPASPDRRGWTRVSCGAQYVWVLRVPLLAAAVLVALPTLGFAQPTRPYVAGIFDLVSRWALALVVPLALFNAWTIVIVAALIISYGGARFGLPPASTMLPPGRTWIWLAGGLPLAAPIVIRTIAVSGELSGTKWVVPFLCGVGLAALLAVVANIFNARSRRVKQPAWYAALLRRLNRHPFLSAGFIGRVDDHDVLLPGHGLAFGLASVSVVLYGATGFLTRHLDRLVLASALEYALLLVLVLTWLAGLVAFLFDRVRVPLVVLLLGWFVVVTYAIDRLLPTDDQYGTVSLPHDAPPLADLPHLFDVTRGTRGTRTPIVIAVSGGGIHAAAWATLVMTELDKLPGFAPSLRLISAVSGGSVGAMNLLASRDGCGPARAAGAPAFDPNVASRASSLHAVGWGLVFEDLPRAVFPLFSSPFVDRGSKLEDAWKREDRLRRDPDAYLSAWRAGVDQQRCPGVVFNAMVAETGEPLLFSTVALPASLASYSFYSHYPNHDLRMPTAVRLSAAFPYVSPAARADLDDGTGRYSHVVDGGYFDDYGVSSLAAVADAALAAAEGTGRRLLVVEICDALKCSGEPPPTEPSAGGARRAWPYQLLAPPAALLSMRGSAQRATNRTTLRFLKESWRERGACVETLPASTRRDDAPMSWHLSHDEQTQIDVTWQAQRDAIISTVSAYLQGQPVTPEDAKCLAAAAERRASSPH